jgi:hypothetical protein
VNFFPMKDQNAKNSVPGAAECCVTELLGRWFDITTPHLRGKTCLTLSPSLDPTHVGVSGSRYTLFRRACLVQW